MGKKNFQYSRCVLLQKYDTYFKGLETLVLQDAGLFGIIPNWKFLKLKALDLSSFYAGNYELYHNEPNNFEGKIPK